MDNGKIRAFSIKPSSDYVQQDVWGYSTNTHAYKSDFKIIKNRSMPKVKKEDVGHLKKAPDCASCKHFSYTEETVVRYGWTSAKKRSRKCSFHGFATTPACWCPNYEKGAPVVTRVKKES
jgi:hypothetical protein